MTIAQDVEEVEMIQDIMEKISIFSTLLGIHRDVDRYLDAAGDPVGVTELDAIQQVIARDWKTVRIRSDIWNNTKISDDEKYQLVLLLNVVEAFIHAKLTGINDSTQQQTLTRMLEIAGTFQNKEHGE